MTPTDPAHYFSAAVEGVLDEAVLRRILVDLDTGLDRVFGRKGKAFLRERIGGFNHDAKFRPWIVLVDLDRDAECPPALIVDCLPQPAPLMCFRVAVRELESWLLADTQALAGFLGVRRILIPPAPDQLDDPKQVLVSLEAKARRAEIRRDLVPRPASGRPTGPGYTARMLEFVQDHWRPVVAESNSDSLRRCRKGLLEMGTKLL
ncbi:MAG: hypothetical protein ABSG65_36700 [Bryobacteraceae bacterium]|jgi:hypothetical protein